LKIDGDRVDLSFAEQYVDISGVPVETIRYRITGRVLGHILRIKNSGYSPQDDVLERRTRRFGLAIAHLVPAQP